MPASADTVRQWQEGRALGEVSSYHLSQSHKQFPIMANSRRTTPKPWSLTQSETALDCPYFVARVDQVRDGLGVPRVYYNVRMKNFGIAVVPIDSEGRTILVGQQRYVLNGFTWEVIRGGGSLNRLPLESAKRELSEETGYSADNWLELLKGSASPGLTDELTVGFVAWNLHSSRPHPDAGEELVQKRVPFAQAIDMVVSGEIADLASSALLLAIKVRLERQELPDSLVSCLQRGRQSSEGDPTSGR